MYIIAASTALCLNFRTNLGLIPNPQQADGLIDCKIEKCGALVYRNVCTIAAHTMHILPIPSACSINIGKIAARHFFCMHFVLRSELLFPSGRGEWSGLRKNRTVMNVVCYT